MPKKVILVVIDGLTAAAFESALEKEAPALRFLAEHGEYGHATSTFPSLTPVCLSSIVTGAHPDVHHIPHLVWYHRGERRIVEYAAAVGRWLVTRDGFDFFAFYLPDYDFASHVRGPEGAHEALARSDRAVGTLMDAAGGPDEFLERYAVVVCADHGQTRVEEARRLQDRYAGVDGVVVTASNRAGMVYRLDDCPLDARELAGRLDDEPAAEVALFREGEAAVARRGGEELAFTPVDGGWATAGDESILDQPDALARAYGALANPNAGEVLAS